MSEQQRHVLRGRCVSLKWKRIQYLTGSASFISRDPISIAFQYPQDCFMDKSASWNKVWRPVISGSWATLGPFHQNISQFRGLITGEKWAGGICSSAFARMEGRRHMGRVRASVCLGWAKRLMVT